MDYVQLTQDLTREQVAAVVPHEADIREQMQHPKLHYSRGVTIKDRVLSQLGKQPMPPELETALDALDYKLQMKLSDPPTKAKEGSQ